MLKQLRLKFIALNMGTVAIVLVVVFTAICVISHQQAEGDVYAALNSSISRNAQDMKDPRSNIGQTENSERENAPAEDRSEEGTNDNAPFQIGGKTQNSRFIPVAVYRESEDGTLEALTDNTTASIAEDVLEQATDELSSKEDGSGLLDGSGLYYVKRTDSTGTYLAFADRTSASGWQTLALTLAGVGIAALLVFLVVNLFFSRWALKPVQHAWTQQKRFVADASHELKTPLTVILANSSILLEHPERSIASQSQWVEGTQAEAERMQELVGDLLLLARLDEEEMAPAHEQVDLSGLVEGSLLQFESVAFERGVSLSSNIAGGLGVQGDESRLHRLVITLVDNACKYAGTGGEVHVGLERNQKDIALTVHNSGPVIAPEDLPHVFDRFYRADKARTRDGGYGLGLAIAFAVAEEHGGTLSVESSEERGTTFTATLPSATPCPT